jgi:hypothetical protein
MEKKETKRIITKLMLVVFLVTMSVYSTVGVKAQTPCRDACLRAYSECQFNCRGLPAGAEQTVCLAVCSISNTLCLAQCGL